MHIVKKINVKMNVIQIKLYFTNIETLQNQQQRKFY